MKYLKTIGIIGIHRMFLNVATFSVTNILNDRYLTIMALRDRHNSTRRVGDEWFGVEGWPIYSSGQK
jgi:hypothetical protein